MQQLYVSIYLACNILLNFLIRSQSTAETGCSVAEAGAYCEEGGIDTKVGIGARAGIGAKVGIGAGVGISAQVGIGASPGKNVFGPS